jgi:hypothetical protein
MMTVFVIADLQRPRKNAASLEVELERYLLLDSAKTIPRTLAPARRGKTG